MAIYKFPNLARQTETSTTEGYYSGLNRPTPVGNMYGNQTVGQTRSTTPNLSGNYAGRPTTLNKTGTTRQVSVDPTTGRFMLDGQLLDRTDPRMWGSVGRHVTQGATMDPAAQGNVSAGMFDPNYYEQYTLDGSEGSGGSTAYRLRPDVASRLNGRVQLGQSGVGGYGEVIDPSQVQWDDEFGLVTAPGNFKDPQDPRSRRIGYAAMAAFGAPAIASAMSANMGAGATAGSSSGSFPMVDAPNLAMPATIPAEGAALSGTPLIEGGGAMSGFEGGVNTFGSPPPGGSVAIPPDGGGGFNLSNLYGDGTASGFLGSPLGRVAGGYLSRYMADRGRTDTNTAANRADPFGQYRDSYAQRLNRLYEDPSYLESLPGYRFRRDQGEQAIERRAARRGDYRSEIPTFALAEFNQGLAQQALDTERTNLANLSGANFNPGTSGQILASGYGNSNQALAGSFNSYIGAGGDILDWFFKNPEGVA